jgi:hypothetical protein
MKLLPLNPHSIAIGLFCYLATPVVAAALDFGAYYTELKTGLAWEAFSRTGEDADIVVQLTQAGGQLVFWRGASYLPYWKTAKGRWDLAQIIPRSGDGVTPMPDRVNTYSHVEVIENTPAVVVVHWRYLASFTAGNPHGNVSPNHFVDEWFSITPAGRLQRVIRQGTAKADEWNDPSNRASQVLQLNPDGVVEISRQAATPSTTPAKVAGNPVRIPGTAAPSLWFKFDEGLGDEATEEFTQTRLPVAGPKTLWKQGVSGTALQFDGYHSVLALPAAKAPALAGASLTLEAWFALGAYPWNWAPIIQQGDDDGYFLGIDSHGYPGFNVKVDGAWQQLSVPNKPPYADANHLGLFQWHHAAGTYDKNDGMMRLYVNGKEVANKAIGKGGVQTADAELRVGKAGILRTPTEGTHDTLPSDFGIDGLIDEVKVYPVALPGAQIASAFATGNPGPAIVAAPDMQKRALPVPATGGKFGAAYTRLPYYETWDNLWRFGEHADVVVGFDELPTKFVFWRGVSYIPMMVNESNQWFTHEFNETGFSAAAPGDCEPMSDKGCWSSHVRIIENTPARVVVHWRYRLENPDHHWANYDANGWGDIVDWHYYIYPDGVACKIMRCYSSNPNSWFEWNEQIVVVGEGQHPESVVGKAPVMTLVDRTGKATSYDWNPNPPTPNYKGQVVQKIHFTGKYSPFAIQDFEGGDIYGGERTWYSVFPSWNHWPTAQANSSGRNACFPDRAAHSSISHLFWPLSAQQQGDVSYQEKLLMEGMTDQPPAALAQLAKSWLDAPPVAQVSGATSQGYDRSRRAYRFDWGATPLRFELAASELNPIHNLCFELKHWKSRAATAALKINGVAQAAGPNFRQGVHIDHDGTFTLIVWAGMAANTTQAFELTENQ